MKAENFAHRIDKVSKRKKLYKLMDGRYLSRPERSICYEICDTLKEAKANAKEYGNDTFIVECVVEFSNGKLIEISSKPINQ